MAKVWDELCDDFPTLAAWNARSNASRKASRLLRIVDSHDRPKYVKTASGNIHVTLGAEWFTGATSSDLANLIIEVLRKAAEADGLEPPPSNLSMG